MRGIAEELQDFMVNEDPSHDSSAAHRLSDSFMRPLELEWSILNVIDLAVLNHLRRPAP